MLNKLFAPFLFTVCLLGALIVPFNAFAEEVVEPYVRNQNSTIAFFEQLHNTLKTPGALQGAKARYLSDSEINHLTAIYLHCSMKKGVCPLVLEALFEQEVVNSRVSGKMECKNMYAFWKRWIANGFRERLSYSQKKGLASILEFQRNVRPRYIQCTKTLRETMNAGESDQAFFTRRYGNDSPYTDSVGQLVLYLKWAREKIDDIFIQTGAYRR